MKCNYLYFLLLLLNEPNAISSYAQMEIQPICVKLLGYMV